MQFVLLLHLSYTGRSCLNFVLHIGLSRMLHHGFVFTDRVLHLCFADQQSATMENLPTPDDVCPFGFTEKTDFSIFLKYPDIDYNPEYEKMDEPGPTIHFSSPMSKTLDDGPGPALHFSSPASYAHHHDDTDSASRSNSTPHTTPSRLGEFEDIAVAPDEYQEYLRQLQAADLPETAIQYYRSLANQILQIAYHLQPKTLYLSETTTQNILRDSSKLLNQLQQSSRVISDQISAINHITSLASFTITPTDLALYSIYRQRASLILKHLSLPSLTGHSLHSDLLPVFDAYIYSPYLHLPRHHFSLAGSTRINELYDALNTLINTSSTWLRTIGRLKEQHMTPILRRIQDSSWVQTEITQMEDALEACNRMNSKPISKVVGSVVGAEQVKGAEKLAERRSKSSMAMKERRRVMVKAQTRTRTRVRREHTL